MIITLDTGIHVRATFRSAGPARALLQRIADTPVHTLAVSPYILGELGRVLSYSRLRELLGHTPEEIHDHVEYLRNISWVVEPVSGAPIVLNDPYDDPVIYTAVASGSDVLCTLDKHFYHENVITFCASFGIRIMTDVELLARLSE